MSSISPGFLLFLTALAYLLASVFYGAGTVRASTDSRRPLMAAGLTATVLGGILHTGAIGLRCMTTHLAPFVTASDSLSAVGWAIVVLLILFQFCPIRDKFTAVGAIGMPLAFLCVFAGSVVGQVSPTHASARARLLNDNLVSLHVLAIVFAFGMIALAFGCALLYFVEDRMLKRKSVARLFSWRLPSLITIDNMAFTLVSLAFPLLTIGILAGIIRAVAERTGFSTWGLEPHTLASAVTWAVYGCYLFLHKGMSWSGRQSNSLLIVGLALALATYFAPGTLHRFG
jgi:ABC-type uncharacterized transport system permease subunit